MTEKIASLLQYLKSCEYKTQRISVSLETPDDELDIQAQTLLFEKAQKLEKPVLFQNDSFGFNRHTTFRPPIREGNITPNYARIIQSGFNKTAEDVKKSIRQTEDPEKIAYGNVLLKQIDICMAIADGYMRCAKEQGNEKLYAALCHIPRNGARNLYEALVFLKFCIYCLRLYGMAHLTLGRFDQYLYPFYINEKNAGRSDEEILELIEEFFISINYDTDLYHGLQLGDNGQSMVLGGFDEAGNSMFNDLSRLCMQASIELSVIDPKINLRVGKNTPDEIFEYATLLTKQGLGFPQYCNDDVVVPGLIKLGYEEKDAHNYTVAACWEYIIPDCGTDIPNIATMDFPAVVGKSIREKLQECESFSDLMEQVKNAIAEKCDNIIASKKAYVPKYAPLLSLFVDGCIEKLQDLRRGGAKYTNFGCHGAGIANAADALAAVRKHIFVDRTLEKETLLAALEADFAGYTEIKNLLKSTPKMGENDYDTDMIAAQIMEAFSAAMNNRDNFHGGIWRAGTGSANEYVCKGRQCPATADGRCAGEYYSSSFSPALGVAPSGLLSVIQSFTKFDMTKIINGGPLTIEIHDSVLRNDMGIRKVAQLVKVFIQMGGHQLQLNSINVDLLKDAQKHPEKYPNLIVRVWGWSGYFNELAVEYQNHIISRAEYHG